MTTYATIGHGTVTHAFDGEPGTMPAHGQKATCCGRKMNRPTVGRPGERWPASYSDRPSPLFACRRMGATA